jgi:hypothetical protein
VADYNLSAELRRYCLALEMLRHGARPITVRHWTGFTYARTRQIVRIYNKNRTPAEPRCAPGPPPMGLKKLLKDTQLRVELTAVAGLCRVLKVLPDRGQPVPRSQLRTPEMGEGLCHTYDVYRRLVPNAQLTFEQLVVLVVSLATDERWALERCMSCESHLLIDPLSLEPRLCAQCQNRTGSVSADPELIEIPETPATHVGAEIQQSLF